MAGAENEQFEIGYVLFIDIVGYSKLLIEDQKQQLRLLTEIVVETGQVREATDDQLVRLPTGDGMALVFRNSAEEPTRCALEIAKALKGHPDLKVRMGIHAGPVSDVNDLTGRMNVAGAGINMAQRVMDCGDAGHILVSKRVAGDLEQYERWRQMLHDLGACEVKHGTRIELSNLYSDGVGNQQLPQKFRALKKLRRNLRWAEVAGALVIVMAIAGAFTYLLRGRPDPLSAHRVDKSIAVLPLENLSDEKENAYFADGMQDELLSDLAKIKDLKVISRTSVMQYRTGITRNLKDIAQQLGVSNVIEGSVRRSGNHVRVSVQLIDAVNDRHLWAQNYDRTVADSVTLQGELATQIATEVGANLSPQEKARVEAAPTKNSAAYDAYLRGRALSAGITDNRKEAARAFREAVTLDPNFALAWAYLSCAESNLYWGAEPTPARLESAKAAADRAVALNPNLPENHLALGYYYFFGLRDFSRALAEFQLAEKVLPNDVDVLRALGLIHRRLGQWDDAASLFRRALELDPRDTRTASLLATTYLAERRFSDALGIAEQILLIEPSSLEAIQIKAECYFAMGNLKAMEEALSNPAAGPVARGQSALYKQDYAQALEVFSKELQHAPPDQREDLLFQIGQSQRRLGKVAAAKATYQQLTQELSKDLNNVDKSDKASLAELHSLLGIAYAALGNSASAVSEGKKGLAMQPTSEDPMAGPEREEAMAKIYALLGDADNAIPILKRWIDVPSNTSIAPPFLRIDPVWDPIRSDRRFQQMLAVDAAKTR